MCQAPTCGRKVHAIYLLERRLLCPVGIGPAAPIQSGQLEKGYSGGGCAHRVRQGIRGEWPQGTLKGSEARQSEWRDIIPAGVDFPPPPSLPLAAAVTTLRSLTRASVMCRNWVYSNAVVSD